MALSFQVGVTNDAWSTTEIPSTVIPRAMSSPIPAAGELQRRGLVKSACRLFGGIKQSYLADMLDAPVDANTWNDEYLPFRIGQCRDNPEKRPIQTLGLARALHNV